MKKWHRKSLRQFVLCKLAFFCILFLFGGCSARKLQEPVGEDAGDPGVKITFFDVGKGDAILIETAEGSMLIDAGYDDTTGTILDYLNGQGVSRLEYLVITHFDKDHVGGVDWILKGVEVGEVLQPDYESDKGQYQEYREALEEKGIEPTVVTRVQQVSLGEALFLIDPPRQEEYEEEDNDFSLVISMSYGKRRFLFAGDCERVRLEELLEQSEFSLEHDVLKVPHHGRKEKNSEEFLEAVNPQIAVITCSEEEPADKKVLRTLHGIGTTIYQTSEGTVTCLCDGDKIEIWQGETR